MLTRTRLYELLRYEPESGDFYRVKSTGGKLVGAYAGRLHIQGYVCIGVDGSEYKAHRLAWLYMTGEWPPEQVDHINSMRHDNRWSNLRLATNSENAQNYKRARSDSKSGLLGTYFISRRARWASEIQLDGKKKHLGYFLTKEEAHAKYIEAKRLLHTHCSI